MAKSHVLQHAVHCMRPFSRSFNHSTACASNLKHIVYELCMQVLGGIYLANYVETHNQSAPVAKLRREWFITYASSDKSVLPAATPCAGQLTQQQLANYTQVRCATA
jgi:hypothetical protein